MNIKLSKSDMISYVGDILPLSLEGDGVDRYSKVTFSVCGNAVALRTFERDKEHSAGNCVLVLFMSPGDAVIQAEYNGQIYKTSVKVRPISHVSSEDAVNYYFADMHAHTSPIHNHDLFAKHEQEDITDYIDFIKNDPLDLSVISDHAGVTNDHDFFRGFALAENCPSTVILAGAESEVKFTELDRFGILHRHSGEILTFMSKGYGKVDTWEELEREIDGSPAPIAIFAHPNIVGFSTNGMWNFDFFRHASPTMLNAIRGIEAIDGGDKDEFLAYEYCYSAALDAGFRVSPTADLDSHGPVWGYDAMIPKTIIMAKENSKEAFHDALRSCRFYCTESGNVKLSYSVNNKTAPADLTPTSQYRFEVKVDTFKDDSASLPVLCQVISDYGKTVAEYPVTGKAFEIDLTSDSARYFYLRLTDSKGRHTWSCPVWCGRPFDTLSNNELEPIDMSDAKAFCDGVRANKLICGDPTDSYHCGQPRPTIVIDLGKEKEISGFGYFPHIIMRNPEKGPQWRTSHESRNIVSHYKLYSSVDGESYTLLSEKYCQYLGDENVIEFPERTARYIKMEVLSTVGANSGQTDMTDCQALIGELSLFRSKNNP